MPKTLLSALNLTDQAAYCYWLGLILISISLPSRALDDATTAHAPLISGHSLDSTVSSHSQLKVSSGSDTGHSSGSEHEARDSSPFDEIAVLAAPETAGSPIQIIKIPLADRSPRGLLATFRATPPLNSPTKLTEASTSPALPVRTTPVLTPSHSANHLVTLAAGYRPGTPTADPEFIPSPRTLAHRLTHSHAATYEQLNTVLTQLKNGNYRRSTASELEIALEFAQSHRKLDAVLTILTYCRETDYRIDQRTIISAHDFLREQQQQQQRELAKYLETKQLTLTTKLLAAVQPEVASITRELERRQLLLTQIAQATVPAASALIPPRLVSPPTTLARRSNSEFGYLATDTPLSPPARPATPFAIDHPHQAQQRLTLTAAQLFAGIKRDYATE